MTTPHTNAAIWVLDYLRAIETTGQHAPTATMQRVADSQRDLLAALQAAHRTLRKSGYDMTQIDAAIQATGVTP